jgi:hypothetical protein
MVLIRILKIEYALVLLLYICPFRSVEIMSFFFTKLEFQIFAGYSYGYALDLAMVLTSPKGTNMSLWILDATIR